VVKNTFGVDSKYIQKIRLIEWLPLTGMERLAINTSLEYLLKFVDYFAVPWLERKWRNVKNVYLWRELLTSLEGSINVAWV
jgi:hypothetical protein